MTQDMNHTFVKALRAVLVVIMTLLTGGHALAQESSQTSSVTGVVVKGNVYGGGNEADVKINSEVNISTGQVEGNVYGGGNLGDVGTHVDQDPVSAGNYIWKDQDGNNITVNTANNKMTGVSKVTITGGTVGVENPSKPKEHGNVFGGGKGSATTFECEQGMVYQTTVSINTDGTVKGNVYGGGEVSRVEGNTVVTIGTASGTDEPIIEGSIFAAGAGIETHGYSALVRGTSTVTVQGSAQVLKNVYGGGEMASVGRYNIRKPGDNLHTQVAVGMPYELVDGGTSTVIIQDNAVIGTDNVATTGHVYGAGQGLEPRLDYDYYTLQQYGAIEGNNEDDYIIGDHKPKRMITGGDWEYFVDEAAYLQFVETLALSATTHVTINGSNTIVRGSVFGGSESGFVYHDTDVKIQNGTINGDAFGGGRGLESFAEAGRVSGITELTISGGSVRGNVYGGGNLGDVGKITKPADYNYTWKKSDGITANTLHNNTITSNNTNTGICKVTISGGTIGISGTESDDHGNVFGAGRGSSTTWWCEKAMVFATNVSVKNGSTVHGNIYGGGQIGRVEDDAKVEIGTLNGSDAPDIKGDVFGAGAGIATHGYSALVRGNADVAVQGAAQVGGNVYGGGEIASVGRFTLVKGLPVKPQSGGNCKVTIQDAANIGSSGTDNDVYGACKGVNPANIAAADRKSMQLFENRPKEADGITYKAEDDGWVKYPGDDRFVWVTYTEADYPAFLRTLALTSHTDVTIDEEAHVYGDVYGGGQRGLALGKVVVKIEGGTVQQDVYGGGALADTNSSHWDATNEKLTNYIIVPGLTVGESTVSGYYVLNNGKYEPTSHTTAQEGTDYYEFINYNTIVRLTGGTILRNAYGGGLGDANNPAYVYGDVLVDLNGTTAFTTNGEDGEPTVNGEKTSNTTGCIVNQVFGGNNVNGSPKDDVIVHVYATQNVDKATINSKYAKQIERGTNETLKAYLQRLIEATVIGENQYMTGVNSTAITTAQGVLDDDDATDAQLNAQIDNVKTELLNRYDVMAVYGGGNQAAYIPMTQYDPTEAPLGSKTQVIIDGCDYTSIKTVYGGGNAASVPETNVTINSDYEIESAFGGGNGKDAPAPGVVNPGADVGQYKNSNNTQVRYGTGNANLDIKGGVIHEAYGASNSKGAIKGSVNLTTNPWTDTTDPRYCAFKVDKMVGAGKEADIDGDVILVMGCMPTTKTPLIFGGADNANVNGNVELTITSGTFGQVFGGNNLGGYIKGHIKLNIEETGCNPIVIDELYLGGNQAAYSIYGYYNAGTSEIPNIQPRTAAMHSIAEGEEGYIAPVGNPAEDATHTFPYAEPVLNVISCTYIGKVFGGGFGEGAVMHADPTVNINMIKGSFANAPTIGVPGKMTALSLPNTENTSHLGIIGDVFGGGNEASVIGNPTVNIGTAEKVEMSSLEKVDAVVGDPEYEEGAEQQQKVYQKKTVEGAYITGDVFGGGNQATVTGNTFVYVCAVEGDDPTTEETEEYHSVTPGTAGVTIRGTQPEGGFGRGVFGGGNQGNVSGDSYVYFGGGAVNQTIYGGGCEADVLGNTHVTMLDGYVFDGVCGGGLKGSVGTIETRTTVAGHGQGVTHTIDDKEIDCLIGKPETFTSGTGKCTVLITGGQVGPATVATIGMGTTTHPAPISEGWVWGAGRGVVKGQDDDPDTDFRTYVNETDVTIGGTAFIMEGVVGGGEFGRVRGNTWVKIQDHCQIGVGAGEVDNNGKPIRYTDGSGGVHGTTNQFVDPVTTTITSGTGGNALAASSCFPYGRNVGTDESPQWVYDTYDPYADEFAESNPYPGGSTDHASDGRTWIGCVFAGGSGYFPYKKKDGSGYDWLQSAGLVEGNAKLQISGGHILTNAYGGNEYTNVMGTCTVEMSGGTIGVPRTLDQIKDNPMIGNLFGAGKGDPRVHFNKKTNVGDVVIRITGGIIYGSVFGGGEDGHVLKDVSLTIGKSAVGAEGEEDYEAASGPTIGTWGTSYFEGNVFGGGRGFTAEAYTAGNVAGSVDLDIYAGNILGSVYGGGRLGSVGYGLFDKGETGYGDMRDDDDTEDGFNTEGDFTNGRGHIDISISGGTIGNKYEYDYIAPDVTGTALTTAKANMPYTEHDEKNILKHTKGGNVFAGGMGRMYQLDGTTPISDVDWWKLGCVKSTTLTISGDAKIKSNVYGGGEMGLVVGIHETEDAEDDNVNVGTEVIINGGSIGTEIKDASENVKYTFGSVFGGGYGSLEEKLTHQVGNTTTYSYPKYIAGRVKGGTKVDMTAGTVSASVYGGGEMAAVGEALSLEEELTEDFTGDTHVIISGGTIGKDKVVSGSNVTYFGGAKMGNVYGGGSGSNVTVRSGHVYGNTNVTINAGSVSGEPKIYHNVYGGGAYGSVGDFQYSTTTEDPNYPGIPKVDGVSGLIEGHSNSGVARVTVNGGTIGVDGKENGMVFGSSRGDIAAPGERDDYGAWVNKTYVTIGSNGTGPAIKGSVYGSGENGHVFNDTEVAIHGGTIGIHDGTAADATRGNVYGGGCGEDTYKYDSNNNNEIDEEDDERYNPLSGIVYGNTKVTMDGGTVLHNVYGAGALGSVGEYDTNGVIINGGKTTIEISGGRVGYDGNDNGNVYGAARGDIRSTQTGISQVKETEVNIQYTTTPTGDNEGKTVQLISGSVFGGGQAGIVQGSVAVNMSGGLVLHDVYGGGALANTQTCNWDATTNAWATGMIDNDRKTTYTTHVSLTGGTIKGDAYGGGLGQVGTAVAGVKYTQEEADAYNSEHNLSSGDEGFKTTEDWKTEPVEAADGEGAVEAMVYGDVLVELNGKTTTENNNKRGCAVNHVFGCNNLNGTPKGKVKVHVYATQSATTSNISTKARNRTNPGSDPYDVEAVYGGGNLAPYIPYDATLDYNANKATVDAARAQVIIEGCEVTSIKQVYGGGNAAPVPATFVEITSAYEIDEAFGGGNGADNYSLKEGNTTVWYQNPGANVGYYTYASHPRETGQGDGSQATPYQYVEDPRYQGGSEKKAARLAATDIQYGSGIARLEVEGGTVHTAYGGSNSKGNVRALLSSLYSASGGCDMALGTSYGGGKNAYSDADADVEADCAHGITQMFGGSENADFDGDINLRITNGSSLNRVFGGNNTSGAINGSITVTIEEGGCEPIRINELYLGGFLAPYSVYGYKKNGDVYATEAVEYLDENNQTKTRLQRIPLKAGEQGALQTPRKDPRINVISATYIGNIFGGGYQAKLVGNPHVNINMKQGKVEVTRTLKENTTDEYIYTDAAGNEYDAATLVDDKYYATLPIGEIGNVYGGGNMADIIGDTHVEIGTGEWINDDGKREMLGTTQGITTPTTFTYDDENKVWKYVSGGTDENPTYTSLASNVTPAPARNAAKITGNVFGGGMGLANTFQCEKAMVGEDGTGKGSTNVIIGNGTVGTLDGNGKLVENTGNVYGGGQIARVENNTSVTIGLEGNEANEPTIYGCVFGGGKGEISHGYSALVRGNPTVIIQGKAKVGESVYGGGEIASVGSFWVKDAKYPDGVTPPTAPTGTPSGMPYALKVEDSGTCTVTIRGNAEIGPNDMQMPDFKGHVFGAGKGILPGVYTYAESDRPRRMVIYSAEDHAGKTNWEWVDESDPNNKNIWEYFEDEPAYIKFIETLAMTAETEVSIEGNAFVKGSVYGGSENGHVLNDTHVMIAGGQIGNGSGTGKNNRFDWTSEDPSKFSECASWPYGKTIGTTKYYLPYDVYDIENGKPKAASDGHTFYGNVFGGGSGYFPYRRKSAAIDGHAWVKDNEKTAVVGQPVDANGYSDGVWLRSAGAVFGNTRVDITAGHILTSVYGGNECTDVGKYLNNSTTPEDGTGMCTVNMTGGTVGVPREDEGVNGIKAHPVTGYLFGAGKGDQRINFNTWTNVASTQVNISGTARIYGSTFGGGEDGHVLGDAETNIGGTVTILNTDGNTEEKTYSNVIIGTTGTSYVDGNVFGGGRGFSGDAQTAGTVGGNVRVNISNGTMLGSVYGGGRLASVGTSFEYPTLDNGAPNPAYGNFKEDYEAVLYKEGDTDIPEGKKVGDVRTPAGIFGHVTINVSGGTIGNEVDNAVSGNVFGGSMGRLTLLKGGVNPIWPKMAQVKTTAVNIYGDAEIKRSVYAGGELGTVRDDAYVTIGGVKKKDVDENGVVEVEVKGGGTVGRDVYGGGYGSEDDDTHTIFTVKELEDDKQYHDHTYAFTPMQFAGCVGQNTFVHICGGQVKKSVYGGGELASVGVINCRTEEVTTEPSADKFVVEHENGSNKWIIYKNMVKHAPVKENNKDVYYSFGLSWPYEFKYVDGYDGATHVHITGGRIGLKDGEPDFTDDKDNGDVCGGGKGKAGDYNDYVFCANVGSTEVIVNYTNSDVTPTNNMGTGDCISGAVYGGAENGHVMGDTKLKMIKGVVGHSIYGGGSGKGQFKKWLTMIPEDRRRVDISGGSGTAPNINGNQYEATCYSITAGKVFGNTEIEMSGGYVVRNVYGGGNMGSVGKGNYSGGSDDYSAAGYGELPPKVNDGGGPLWTTSTPGDNPEAPDFPWHFLHSGKCKVTITGGEVGYINESNPEKSMYPLDSKKNPYDASLPYGNVFGGCRGVAAPNIGETPRYLYCPEFFMGYANETEVVIGKPATGTPGQEDYVAASGPMIAASVYGGGMDGHVRRDASVKIYGGTIGQNYDATKFNDNKIIDKFWPNMGNVYGAGSGIGKYQYDFNYDGDFGDVVTYMNPLQNNKPSTMKEEDFSSSAGSVTRFTKVEILGGNIHRNVYGGGSLSTVGAPKIPPISIDPYRKGDTTNDPNGGKQTFNEVIIAGGQIGDASSYDANGNHKYGGHVYGGSRGSTDLDNSFSTAFYTAVNIIGDADVKGDVYGGGEAGTVKGAVDVNIAGGAIHHDVYGGGALADTQTSNWNATANENAGDWANTDQKSALYQTKVNILGGSMHDVYGGGLGRQETGTNSQPGYIAPIEAKVYGDVYVNLNGFDQREVTYDPVTHGATGDNAGARLVLENNEYLVKDDVKGAVVSRIFGCNNLNGSPQGSTKVHVFKTQNKNASRITNPAEGEQTAKVEKRYDLEAVYGGGNMAAYEPKDLTNGKTQVIIDGCDRTSIYQVYGGGNAASTPATNVEVLGTYEIFELFGGGNGADDLPDGSPNPGANVGYKDYHLVENNPEFATKDARVEGTAFAAYRYGTGVATVDVKGGTIHRVFGGSNTKGNVRQTALTLLEEESGCPFCVDEAYGGGKSAPMDAEAQLHMACIPGLKEAYGGAEAADIRGDVTLNITNGTFDRVFGGNNISGTIRGSITVNIEETGCKPIIIGELYGGGNQAGYSIYGYNDNGTPRTKAQYNSWYATLSNADKAKSENQPYNNPQLNVRSFTSIGDVYGGGYGSSAEMVGSPTVNINVTEDGTTEAQTYYKETVDHDGDESTPEVPVYVSNYDGGSVTLDEGLPTEHTVTLPSHEKGKMGAINNVFGGGNAAKVTGNTYVNIGTLNEVVFETPTKKTVTTTENNQTVTTEVPTTDADRTKTVKGADIRGNVYGGGNAAEVTGNTNVVIGKEKQP